MVNRNRFDKGGSRKLGESGVENKNASQAKVMEVEGEKAVRAMNIMVGDFISELYTTIRYKQKTGLQEGDWIEDPERAYTDGGIFGEEVQSTSDVKLQISLTLDTSLSMWHRGNSIAWAGPLFQAMHQVLRQASMEFPEGCINYQPFIFHGTAGAIPDWAVSKMAAHSYKASNRKDSVFMLGVPVFTGTEWEKAGNWATMSGLPLPTVLYGRDTKAAPLFKAIQGWEQKNDPDAVRIDIIITDGLLDPNDNKEDVAAASKIQRERNGRMTTVMLNLAKDWDSQKFILPERCYMYTITPSNLTNRIRDILSEAIADLP